MTRTTWRPVPLVAPLLALPALVVAPPAAASCAEVTVERLVAAPQALLVRVEDQRGSLARVEVQQVWSGPDRPPGLEITTGERDPGVGSSMDVQLQEDQLYVVAVQGEELRTSACSALQVSPEEARAAAPASARPPVDGAPGAAAPPLPPVALVGLVGGALSLLGSAVALLQGPVRRRWRRAGPTRQRSPRTDPS